MDSASSKKPGDVSVQVGESQSAHVPSPQQKFKSEQITIKNQTISGDFDSGVMIPIQKTTLKLLSALFKEEGPKSTSIDFLLQDPLLSEFMDYNFDRGAELDDHCAVFWGSLDKFTRNKRLKISVGEDTNFMPDFTDNKKGKTKVDETTTVGMLQESDEATNFGNDQADDEMNDDEADVAETDEDMDKEAEYQHDSDSELEDFRVCGLLKDKSEDIPDTRSPFEKVMDDPFIEALAERISNYEDLIGISDKFLENLRKNDVSIAQHEELVAQFWDNKQFFKGLCEELYESPLLFGSMVNFARMVVEEEPYEKVDRIKKDPAVKKLFDEKDRVVKMRGILGILIGYYINKDMIVARGDELYASDAVPKNVKRNSGRWSYFW